MKGMFIIAKDGQIVADFIEAIKTKTLFVVLSHTSLDGQIVYPEHINMTFFNVSVSKAYSSHYTISYLPKLSFGESSKIVLRTSVPSFVGCFKDKIIRALPVLLGLVKSVKECLTAAAKNGYLYAGLQSPRYCFAGNSGYDRYGVRNNDLCYKLPDRSIEFAAGPQFGRFLINSVFRISKELLQEPSTYQFKFLRKKYVLPQYNADIKTLAGNDKTVFLVSIIKCFNSLDGSNSL